MKKILHTSIALTALSISTSATAAIVFTENFDGKSFDHQTANDARLGGAAPEIAVGDWFSSSNGAAMNNEIQLTNFADGKSRGAGIWLDSSAWANGTVTVKFDILDYIAGGVDSESFFQAYYANGVNLTDSGVGIDTHGGGGADPATVVEGTATIGTIGARNTITSNATQATFTFNFTGEENIALVFHNMSGATGAMPIYSVDNLTVDTIPEPSSTALLGLGGLALILRRRK